MIKYFDASWKEIDAANATYAVELEHDADGLVTSSKTYIVNKSTKATISFKGGKGSGFVGHPGGKGGKGNPGGSQSIGSGVFEIDDAKLSTIVESNLDVKPNIKSITVLKSNDFNHTMKSKFGQVINIENIAALNHEGDIYVREGFEDSALHEYIHSAGFMPDGKGIDPTINEGLTQAATIYIGGQAGIIGRSGYDSAVDYVNKYIIPLTGMDRGEFFRGYAKTDNKQQFIASAIWSRYGNKFNSVENWGKNVEHNFNKFVATYGGHDIYLSYLVDELGITKEQELKSEKVKEEVVNGKKIRIIYIIHPTVTKQLPIDETSKQRLVASSKTYIANKSNKATVSFKGGKGSGNKGHLGRPGMVGGSGEGNINQTIAFGGTKGTAVGQAYGDNIAIDKNYYSTLSNAGKEQLIAHELAHNIVEDKILSNNTEWDKASNALLLKVVERDKVVYHQFILGQSRIGEAISETIAVYTQGHENPFANFVPSFVQPNPSWDTDKWNGAMKWAEHALKYVGVSKEQFNRLVTKLRNDLDSESYSVTKQLPIDEASKLRLVEVRMGIFNSDIDILSEKMFVGDVTLNFWEESMKRLIRELHTSVAAIYKGGWDQMTWEDWGRLGPVLKEQYKYLHGFAQAIADNRDTISLRAIQARAHMYGDAALQSAGKAITHIAIQEQLPWMPREGTGVGMGKGQGSECRIHCCCAWVMTKMGMEKDFNIVQAVWTLSPAEHCDTCIERKGHTVMLRVYKDIDIPDHIGFYCG